MSRPAPIACTQALSVLESPAALKREQSKLLAFEILCTAAVTHKKVRGVVLNPVHRRGRTQEGARGSIEPSALLRSRTRRRLVQGEGRV